MSSVYISLGSNLGDREENLLNARLSLAPSVQVLAASRIYETEPWGYQDQPPYLNQVLKAETELPPHDLLLYLKAIETRLGRQPTFRYGPRPIDLDLLFYDTLILQTPDLLIPHARLAERAFVLVPLAELDPSLVHPALGFTVLEMLAGVDTSGVKLYSAGAAQPHTQSQE